MHGGIDGKFEGMLCVQEYHDFTSIGRTQSDALRSILFCYGSREVRYAGWYRSILNRYNLVRALLETVLINLMLKKYDGGTKT